MLSTQWFSLCLISLINIVLSTFHNLFIYRKGYIFVSLACNIDVLSTSLKNSILSYRIYDVIYFLVHILIVFKKGFPRNTRLLLFLIRYIRKLLPIIRMKGLGTDTPTAKLDRRWLLCSGTICMGNMTSETPTHSCSLW